MKIKIISTLLGLSLLFILSSDISAYNQLGSASMSINNRVVNDYRVSKLKNTLEYYKSPLSDYSDEFVECADKYKLDWRLLPAITGVESTFGKRIPFNSYNAYGWANGKYYFNSWEESIITVCKALRTKYYDRGLTDVNSIARVYAPPSTTWATKVKFFMNKIDQYPINFSL